MEALKKKLHSDRLVRIRRATGSRWSKSKARPPWDVHPSAWRPSFDPSRARRDGGCPGVAPETDHRRRRSHQGGRERFDWSSPPLSLLRVHVGRVSGPSPPSNGTAGRFQPVAGLLRPARRKRGPIPDAVQVLVGRTRTVASRPIPTSCSEHRGTCQPLLDEAPRHEREHRHQPANKRRRARKYGPRQNAGDDTPARITDRRRRSNSRGRGGSLVDGPNRRRRASNREPRHRQRADQLGSRNEIEVCVDDRNSSAGSLAKR